MVISFFMETAEFTISVAVSSEILSLFRSLVLWWTIMGSGEGSWRQPLRWYFMAFEVAAGIDLTEIVDPYSSASLLRVLLLNRHVFWSLFHGRLLDLGFLLFFWFTLFTFLFKVILLISFWMNRRSYVQIPSYFHDHDHVIYFDLHLMWKYCSRKRMVFCHWFDDKYFVWFSFSR